MGGSAYNEHLQGQILAWAPREGPRASGGPGFSQPPMIITAATQMTPLHGDRPHEGALYIATHNNPTLHLGKWRFERLSDLSKVTQLLCGAQIVRFPLPQTM